MGKSAINEDRLFRNLPYFFSNPSKVTTELIQNAERSGADRASIEYRDGVLKVIDNGSGTSNPEALLVLAESDWDEKVLNNSNPAGFGLFFLFSVSETVTVRSLFGELTINCARYMEDRAYRETILDDNIPHGKTDQGFEIVAVLKKDVAEHFAVNTDDLAYFPLSISFNGEGIERKYTDTEFASYKIKTTYLGNKVYINPSAALHVNELSDDHFERKMMVIWYGMAIRDSRRSQDIIIDVKSGTPLTPQLPYRYEIQRNSSFYQFKEFVRKEIVDYCLAAINTANTDASDKRELFDMMKIMSTLATQDELDMLNIFYIREREKYYDDEDVSLKIIKKGSPAVISEEIIGLHISKGGETKTFASESMDIETIVIPSGFITHRSTAEKHPVWLTIENKGYIIEVICGDIGYELNYGWQDVVSITCGDKGAMPILSDISGWSDGRIFYKDLPTNFWEISDMVFKMRVFYQDFDTDTYDTQQDYFNKVIEADIMALTGRYDMNSLLGGLRTAEIDPFNVTSISINHEAKELVICFADSKQQRCLKLS